MRYLDAKKRLAFMLATVKYIRLYMDKNPSVKLNDILKPALLTSFQIIPDGYTITMQDLSEIVCGTKSLLLEDNTPKVGVADSVNLTIQKWNGIMVDELTRLSEALKLEESTGLRLDLTNVANVINLLEAVNLSVDQPDSIESSDKILLTNEANLDVPAINVIKPIDITITQDILSLLAAKSDRLNLANQLFKVSHQATLETMEIRNAITSDSHVYIKDYTNLIVAKILGLIATSMAKTAADAQLKPTTITGVNMSSEIKVPGLLAIDHMVILSLKADSMITSTADFQLPLVKPNSLETEEKILTIIGETSKLSKQFNKLEVWDLLAKYIISREAIDAKLDSALKLEFETFIPLDFMINSTAQLRENVLLAKQFSKRFEVFAKLFVSEGLDLSLYKGAEIAHDYTISVKDQVILGRFKYSILGDHDPKYISELDNLILDDLIYITT